MRYLIAATVLTLAAPSAALAQDAAAGEKQFTPCRACHQVGETAKNGVGPVLNGVVGRPAGSVEGFAYSPAMKNSGITWDEANLTEFIKDPKGKVPGTKMVFPGIKDDKKVADLIAFLKQYDKSGKKAADLGSPTTLAAR